jgi:hypothetical protein
MRVPYRPWQKVHNVGFRVVAEAAAMKEAGGSKGEH